ncbi:hypothetical protein [Devosia sp.]|uniref:pPIWI-associating nuclease domain-containing protein n=1 Tax=Devosia sp. TaxID=1871048 RepID=UPI003BAAEC98
MTEGIEGPYWQSAIRVGEETLFPFHQEAEAALFAAHGANRLGSDSLPRELARLASDHYRKAARETAKRYWQLKGRKAAARSEDLRKALSILELSVLQTFDTFDGTGSLFDKPIGQRKTLQLELAKITDNTCDDLAIGAFDLPSDPTETSGGSAPRLVPSDVALVILEIFARSSKAHKINVLGRPHQSGPLEAQLGMQFTNDERAEVAQLLEQLISDGLLRPTYSDIADPENWLEITQTGRVALATGAVDELEAALLPLGQHLVDMRRGAKAAMSGRQPDSQRQAAFSARELLVQVLHALAPDEDVKSQAGFGNSTVSRKARVRFILKNQTIREYSDSTAEMVESLAGWVETVYGKLSAEGHGRVSARQAKHLVQSVDLILETLLL